MRALVLGGSGQLGAALAAVLEREGVETTATHHAKPGPGTRALDVRDAAAVRDCIAAARPDVVFWAVNNPGGPDYCEDHPRESRALHVEGARAVFEAAAGAKARLVFYSTDYVFDGKDGPYAEDAARRPLSVYGAAKKDGEDLARELCPGALILRTTVVYGWNRASRNFAMQVWERLQAGQVMKVPSDQMGNPTLAEYLAEASLRLVQLGAEGVYNASGKDVVSRADFAKALAGTLALDPGLIQAVPTSELRQRSARPLKGGLKTAKLAAALGTEPWDLKDSLSRFRRHWRADTHAAIPARRASDEAEGLRREILGGVRRYWELAHKPKPFVPYQTRIQYAGRVYGDAEMTNLVDSALDFWLTLGPYGDLFEGAMRRFFGSADFIAVNSGSTANLAAVMTLTSPLLEGRLKPGDEVLTPAVTFPTTLAPLVHAGLIPVFVDCEVGTYNVNPALLADALSPKTRAIMVPHTLGNPCDLDVLCALAKERGLWLVEDTCDALGAKFQGRLAGTFGDLATLSFYPAHHITMGEGGGVVINKARLSRIARSVRDWGRDCWCAPGESNTCGRRFGWRLGGLPEGYDHKYIYSNLGYNFKPTDLQAAIGAAQAERLPDFIAARRRNFRRIYDGLKGYEDKLILPRQDPRAEPSWFAFPVTVTGGLGRRELVAHIERANIETRELFGGNILRQPAYQDIPCRVAGPLAETDRIMRDAFFIGVYPGLTEEMIDFVLKTFADFFAKKK